MSVYDENLAWIVPNDMAIFDETKRTEMGGLIRDLYTGGEPLAEHLGDGVRVSTCVVTDSNNFSFKYSSDTSFTRSIIKHAELFSQVAETYFYVFSYSGQIGGNYAHYDGAESVGHNAEIPYLFCTGNGCDGSQYPEADVVTRQRLIKIWTDFAKYRYQ